MPTGYSDTKRLLENNDIEVIEVEIDEVMNGGGAVHCMTVFLKRDPVT